MAPSDYYFFPEWRRWPQGQIFYLNEEIKWEADAYFESFDKLYYMKGVEILEERREKCTALKGDYVEEEKKVLQKNVFFISSLKTFHPMYHVLIK